MLRPTLPVTEAHSKAAMPKGYPHSIPARVPITKVTIYAITISSAPIILLDEVESGGIFKEKVMASLKSRGKAVLFVTHDPIIALLADRRIVMKNGAVEKIITPDGREDETLAEISAMDTVLSAMRERLRAGELLLRKGCS